MLIIFSGLPGAGKTTIARALAKHLQAVYLRIDSIEHAIADAEHYTGPMDDTGYKVAYAVAEDNLRNGLVVVGDSVNSIAVCRSAWWSAAEAAGRPYLDVLVKCSDEREHRRRVEQRWAEHSGKKVPRWGEVLVREFEPFETSHVVLDTAAKSENESLDELIQHQEISELLG